MTGRRLAREDPDRVSERDYTRTVTDLLQVMGWATNHVYPLRTEHGWRTGYSAVGWPDLVAFRREFVLGIELKGYDARGDRGRLGPQQIEWLERFAAIPTGRGWLLRPTDPPFATLVEWVRHPADAPRSYGYPMIVEA